MIQELIDQALAKKSDRIRSGKYSPSLLGRCYRLQYWNRKNELPSNPPDERTQRIFKAGDLFHEFIEGIVIKNDPTAQKEVLIEDTDFKGYADLVLKDEVIDIKSQHSKSFWYRTNLEWKDLEPKLYNNILQVMYYAVNLDKPRARLVFISKDDCCVQEYGLAVDKKWMEELKNEVNVLTAFWLNNQFPPAKPRCYPDKEGKFKECQYCNWKDLCIRTEKGE